jgi:holo-[acyl-carrier protein] synthase
MAIKGIGNDIIQVTRLEGTIARYGQRFLDRTFTAQEQKYCLDHKDSTRHFAGRWAAKEAIVKALGHGFSEEVSWLDIEIANDTHGKPYPIFSDSLNQSYNTPTVLLSISHCKDYATAIAIWEV